ncbi:MAG: hypothetical protein WAX89_00820 [Alphaproteobacteria bacterium]
MKYQGSIRAEKVRDRKLQVTTRRRNKAGEFKGQRRVTMSNKRVNGKTGRYSVTQG